MLTVFIQLLSARPRLKPHFEGNLPKQVTDFPLIQPFQLLDPTLNHILSKTRELYQGVIVCTIIAVPGSLDTLYSHYSVFSSIGHVNNIPTMQFFTGFPEILSQNLIMLSLTESGI